MNKQEIINVLQKEYTNIIGARDRANDSMQYVKLNERAQEVKQITEFISANLDEPKKEKENGK